jgi:N-acetyl-anhydromuramyl-L-alanine amidase AmpD
MPIRKDQIRNPRSFLVETIESPNSSKRRLLPRVVLVHATVSSAIGGTIAWLQNPKSKVSADYVIGKDGRIVRMVGPGRAAWHAGTCSYKGKVRSDYNHLSYGIELVNLNDGHDPYPEIQLEAMAFVIAHIQLESPTVKLIRRHADVAFPLGRKSDPAGLSIAKLYETVRFWQPDVILE